MSSSSNAWILSARFDMCFILAPAILISLFVLIFSAQLETLNGMPSWLWLVLIVGVDAGHVYSTLFRTYLVKHELEHRQALLTLIPLLAWLVGCLLYSIDSLLFWRALAYLAVFHFIRQQYGFMMIYARNERNVPRYYRTIDKAAIYSATLYPIIYWHCQGRTFDWFIADDFILINLPLLNILAVCIYLIVLSVYLFKEINVYRRTRTFNLPRNLLLLGTALSWYIGIVAFNNDLIFTATNVIAHGIPYYALIWAYGYKQRLQQTGDAYYFISCFKKLFCWKFVPVYILLLSSVAYVEEGFWDGLIWHEHSSLFYVFARLPIIDSPQILQWLVPLLALPQATHYILDAFIWRLQHKDIEWKRVLFEPPKKIDFTNNLNSVD